MYAKPINKFYYLCMHIRPLNCRAVNLSVNKNQFPIESDITQFKVPANNSHGMPAMFSTKMQLIRLACLIVAWLGGMALAISFYCSAVLKDVIGTNPNWTQITNCLTEVGSHTLSLNTSAAIWEQTKIIYGAVENIPNVCYDQLNYVLRAIPVVDLANVSMSTVDVIESFSRVREIGELVGYNLTQRQLIAAKIRDEWVEKGPATYSEYDLRVMGVFACHLDEDDILQLRAEAYIAAVEYIGKFRDCQQVEPLAERVKQHDVYGPPANWTKNEVSKVGSIIKGLTETDLQDIGEDLLGYNSNYIPPAIEDEMQNNATHTMEPNITKVPMKNFSTLSTNNNFKHILS